jgi:hypothetical protein
MKSVVSTTRTTRNRVLFDIATFLFIASGMLSAQVGQSYRQLTAAHPGWVQVPGELIRPDCIHQIPAGAKVNISDDPQAGDDVILNGEVIAHYDACPEEPIPTRHLGPDPGPTGNGWVEDSQWDVSLKKGDNVEWIQGYWVVPSAPKTNGALIYLFNGVEPQVNSGSWIMQPVLQYGVGHAGGGNYWAMASWLVGSKAYFSTLTPVNTGDVLIGTTQETGDAGGKLHYLIDAYDDTTGSNSQLSVWSKGIQWAWAFAGVLEAYGVKSCSDFPASGSVDFYGTSVAHGYPSFNYYGSLGFYGALDNYSGKGGPSCGFSVTVSGSSSTLNF